MVDEAGRRLQAACPDLMLLSFIPTSREFVAALERAVIDGGFFRRLEHIAVRYKRMTAADARILPGAGCKLDHNRISFRGRREFVTVKIDGDLVAVRVSRRAMAMDLPYAAH